MNAWHKKYLAGEFSGIPARELYAQRLGTLQDALDLIEDGDCLTWSTHGSEPKAFLSHRPPPDPGCRLLEHHQSL